MVDFTLYPYGNGRLSGDSIQCQHGEDECEGNTILACMQDMYPISEERTTNFVPAFVCMEEENGVPRDDFKKCATPNSLDYDKVMECAQGDRGKKLALAAATNTEALNPPHEYAPWVTLNGAPMRDAAYDLQSNVCDAYDPGDAPASSLCTASALKVEAKKDRAMLHDGGGRGFSVCHKDSWA
jgi:interferon gamma-inducible protein 30